jgi:hypothetical protein
LEKAPTAGPGGSSTTAGGLAFTAYVDTLNPNPDIVNVIQGEGRQMTLAIQAVGFFADSTPSAITVKVKDNAGAVLTIPDADIERILEDSSFQVIRFELESFQTEAMAVGFVTIEVSIDSEKVQILKTVRIVESL